jgi:hypothetical protein
MSGLKAIETRYADHLFRSRTEARWAVALTAMGVAWQYEKEGLPGARSTTISTRACRSATAMAASCS